MNEQDKQLRKLGLVVQTMDAGLWEWDATTNRIQFDDRCSQMLGYEKEELEKLIQENWKELIHTQHLEEMRSTLKSYLNGEISEFKLDYRCRKKSGDWLWVRSTGVTVEYNQSGKPMKTVGTQLDINKIKIAEIGLHEYQENLERMILERTRKLEEAQSELINKAIEAGRFQLSSMVLHNIGNAITPVKINVEEMLSEDFLKLLDYLRKCYQDLANHREDLANYVSSDARGKEVFSLMGDLIKAFTEKREKQLVRIKTVDKAVSYISEILILQQAYTARETDTRQRVNLNLLLEDALQMQAGALEKRHIEVRKKLAANLPELTISKNRLIQVLVNIIKNGYEAIDDLKTAENGNIEVSTFLDAEGVGFEITDSGIGIEPDKIPTLFEFGKSGKGSSGIGLYYCKAFTEKNGGKLIFSSRGKGYGATVRAVFPILSKT